MKRYILATLLLLPLLHVSASAQLVEDYRFKGSVVDTKGNPLAEVRINLRNVTTAQRIGFRADDKGHFDRRNISRGHWEARSEREGYVSQTHTMDWSAASDGTVVSEVKIVLEAEGEVAKRELGKRAAKLYEALAQAMGKGDFADASKQARALLEIGAGSYEYAARFAIARDLYVRNELVAADSAYREVLALKPDLFEAHFDLGGVLEQQGKNEAAIQELTRATELHDDDVTAHYMIGAIRFREGKQAESRPWFEKTVALNPDHAQAHKALGFILLSADEKDYAGAKRHLLRYLELEPTAADAAEIRSIADGIK